MGRRKQKTKRWLREHSQDPYVRRAETSGFRSRAAFKLQEIDQKDRLVRPGQRVVELGSAPGGWTQYLAERLGGRGLLVTVDLLEMQPIAGSVHLQGDFTDPGLQRALAEVLRGEPVDLVISDLAPNITGVTVMDQARGREIWAAVLEFARQALAPGGGLLLKLFAGEEAQQIAKVCAQWFDKSVVRKPHASRSRSSEYYLLNQGFRGA